MGKKRLDFSSRVIIKKYKNETARELILFKLVKLLSGK